MINIFLNTILGLISTIIQIVCLPINTLIINVLPDISGQINSISTVLNKLFDSITWALGIIPSPIITVLLFIISIEIAKHTINISTHVLLRVFNIFQKIKFW